VFKFQNVRLTVKILFFISNYTPRGSWDSSVGMSIVTGCGMDGQCSIPGGGNRFFSTVFRRAFGPTQSPIQSVLGSLSQGGGVARAYNIKV
jgi:hypothetical protein